MAVFIPIIARKQYDELKGILGDLIPETHAEWLEKTQVWHDFWSREGEVRMVHIEPAQYNEYIVERDLPAGFATLMGFAEWVFHARPVGPLP